MLQRLAVQAHHDSRLVALIDELSLFPARVRERGRRYAADGRVGGVTVEDGLINGVVFGSEQYQTQWAWTRDNGWESACNCPVGEYCKHAYALACVVLASSRHELKREEARLHNLLPDTAPMPAGPTPARAPRPALSDDLQRLRKGRAEWERQSALDSLLVGAPVFGLSPYAPPLLDVLREPDADLRCWRLAETIASLADGWVPEPLRPYRNRAELASRFVDRERDALAADLLGWASGRSDIARRRLRVVFKLQGRADGNAALIFEVRVTTPRLADAPRTPAQLQTLRTESLRDPGLFPAEQAAVLDWLADHIVVAGAPTPGTSHELTTQMPLALLERIANSALAVWADDLDPTLAALGGVTPGRPVRLLDSPARLVPECVTHDGTMTIELRFRWPDGQERGLDEAIYIPSTVPRRGGAAASCWPAVICRHWPTNRRRRCWNASRASALSLSSPSSGAVVGALATRFEHLRATSPRTAEFTRRRCRWCSICAPTTGCKSASSRRAAARRGSRVDRPSRARCCSSTRPIAVGCGSRPMVPCRTRPRS
jgi:hypothetical protein